MDLTHKVKSRQAKKNIKTAMRGTRLHLFQPKWRGGASGTYLLAVSPGKAVLCPARLSVNVEVPERLVGRAMRRPCQVYAMLRLG